MEEEIESLYFYLKSFIYQKKNMTIFKFNN